MHRTIQHGLLMTFNVQLDEAAIPKSKVAQPFRYNIFLRDHVKNAMDFGSMVARSLIGLPCRLIGICNTISPSVEETATFNTSTLRAATVRAKASTLGLASKATTFFACLANSREYSPIDNPTSRASLQSFKK